MAKSVHRVAERGAQLTAQLLAFSRRQLLRPEHIVLQRLMVATGDLVRRVIGEAITVEIDADRTLWPLLVDPAQFDSAIVNLAANARDAMPGGGRLNIAMRNATVTGAEALRLNLSSGDYVIVSVSDTGEGMSPEVQQHCFEPFYTTKDVGKGTGLGLSQVYGFARQSGGTATVESAEGNGTTISLYLPRTDTEPEEAAPTSEVVAVSGRNRMVLIVEDQADVREIIEEWLRELNYRVLVAADGIEAREILESSEPVDLLLTDVVMPNRVSGIELARWARQLRPELKVVLVSGYSREINSTEKGEFAFLKKPFRPAELAEMIATLLDQR